MALSISVRCTLLVIAILFAGIFTGCLPVRERLAARAERSGGDYRAECGILTSIALAEYLYHSHTNTGNNAARSGFCIRGWLFAVSVLGVAAIRRNLKNRRNAPPVSVRCILLIRQRTPCSESRAFGWRLPSRTPKPCKVHSCRIPIPFPHKYRKQRYLFQFLHRRTAVCCICSGSCCNQGKFEKTKEMHRLFQYGAHCLSGRERLAARAGRSVGNYRAERRSLARFALAEHRYHSHTNIGNNAARSGFCIRGWLPAVSVLGTSAIRENLKKQKKCTIYFSTVHVACQSENALQREPSVRVAITEQNAEALQGSLLQNTDTIPTQI